MDIHRAQKIIQSADTIQVMLHGQNVWIDSVDARGETAIVYPEGKSGDTMQVDIAQLKEM